MSHTLRTPAWVLAALAFTVGASGEDAPFAVSDSVRFETIENVPLQKGKLAWNALEQGEVTGSFYEPAFALVAVPRKYDRGLIVDRSSPFVVRARSRVRLAAGRYRILLRSLNAARLLEGGRELARTRLLRPNGDGHESVPDLSQAERPGLRPLPAGHSETVVEFSADGRTEHRFELQALVGGKKLRPELGELTVAIATGDAPYRLLAPELNVAFDVKEFERFAAAARQRQLLRDSAERRRSALEDAPYWNQRHEIARKFVAGRKRPPAPTLVDATKVEERSIHNDVDRFVLEHLRKARVAPSPLTSDAEFLRRLSLDVRGVVPSFSELRAFLGDPSANKRSAWIDRFLDDPAWADHWVAYWQDVLAENPGILKPKLNNTGPFRWWIHESFLDNKPLDRFVTELVLMEGSRYGGGPAGFGMATQNDVPMAAKAHVVATAFLGVEMKCARCHDAPFHSYKQKDLFRLAAMLKRGAQKVPVTSTIGASKTERDSLLVEATLKAGSVVEPGWPFASLSVESVGELLRNPNDSRERLAVTLTAPSNLRFARVLANRFWTRYLGRGLVASLEDWESAKPTHPELLDHLAYELIDSGYDAKHLARMILNSHSYQRRPASEKRAAALFAGPERRRLTAEQLLDSLFRVAGKRFESEPLTLDVDARRPVTAFLNLGRPERAWQMVTLSNERDRPALAMPVAQSLLDVLVAFGWRQTRQAPQSQRDEEPTPLQPLILGNGIVGQRVVTLSDDHRLTPLCLNAASVAELVEGLVGHVLSRKSTAREMELFTELLEPGFDERVVPGAPVQQRSGPRHAVSWSNHLSAEATEIKLELERRLLLGDPPTQRLRADWRERVEDSMWALVNSPEFLFVP